MAENLAAVAASIANGHQDFNFAGCCKMSQKVGSHNQFSGQVRLPPPPPSFPKVPLATVITLDQGWLSISIIDAHGKRDQHQYRLRGLFRAGLLFQPRQLRLPWTPRKLYLVGGKLAFVSSSVGYGCT